MGLGSPHPVVNLRLLRDDRTNYFYIPSPVLFPTFAQIVSILHPQFISSHASLSCAIL